MTDSQEKQADSKEKKSEAEKAEKDESKSLGLDLFEHAGDSKDFSFYYLRGVEKTHATIKGHVDLEMKASTSENIREIVKILIGVCQKYFVRPELCPVWGFKFVRNVANADDLHRGAAQLIFYFRKGVISGRELFLEKFAEALAVTRFLFSQPRQDTLNLASLMQNLTLSKGISLRYDDGTTDPYITYYNFLLGLQKDLKMAEAEKDDDIIPYVRDVLILKLTPLSDEKDPKLLDIHSVLLRCYQHLEFDCSTIQQAIDFLTASMKAITDKMIISRQNDNKLYVREFLFAGTAKRSRSHSI